MSERSAKLTPNLWFDHQGLTAASYYAMLFPNSRVTDIVYYPEGNLPDFQREFAGKPLMVDVEIGGTRLRAINAGSEFLPNTSMSFFVNFDPARDVLAEQNLEDLWMGLSFEGRVLMELGQYPFSCKYGWVIDKYGYSWQLMLTNPEGDSRPFLIPCLTFSGPMQGMANAALEFYSSLPGAKLGNLVHHELQVGTAAAGSVQFGEVQVFGQWLTVMESTVARDVSFTEALSFQIDCADQTEIDELWDVLSAVPEAESCGWCKDKFGVSWQIVPENMGELMDRPGAYQRLLRMKKIEIAQF